jgi:uncharacterized protein (TIGR03435 family)
MRTLIGIVAIVGSSVSLFGQSQSSAGSEPAFDVASVKPNRSGDRRSGSNTRPGGGYVGTNLTLHQLVTEAYRLRPFQVVGGPGWVTIDRFDINARAPEGTTGRSDPMLKTLLADRFKLRVHTEPREQQLYALVLARTDGRLGPKLTPSTQECGAPRTGTTTPTPCGVNVNTNNMAATLHAVAQPISRLANALSGFGLETMIVDRTGLTGNFDIELQWTPENLRSAAAAVGGDGASLFTALQEQRALRPSSRYPRRS